RRDSVWLRVRIVAGRGRSEEEVIAGIEPEDPILPAIVRARRRGPRQHRFAADVVGAAQRFYQNIRRRFAELVQNRAGNNRRGFKLKAKARDVLPTVDVDRFRMLLSDKSVAHYR